MEHPAASYRFDKFILETRDRRLSLEGHEVYLRPKTYDTLLFLLERHGHLVTKDALLDGVWGDVEVTENALTRCIKEVRAALGDEVQNPHFLRTVPRLGYEFIADVERSGDQPVEEIVEEELRAVRVVTTEEESNGHRSEPVEGQNPRGAPILPAPIHPRVAARARAVVGGLAALVLAAVALSLGLNVGGWRDRLLGRQRPPHIGSLAVLPLTNLTGDPQQEYFADGMTEELITTLGKISAVRVISRTSVMRYKKTDKSLPQIARELDVDAVIEGAVARAGNRVRVTIQLIQASTDKHLWAESYEGDLRDILALQGQVASAIAGEIKAEIAPQERARLASSRPVNAEAYALYLQGKLLWSRDTEPENRAALDVLGRAVYIDPNFAPAYAALGRAYVDRLFAWEPKDKWRVKAEQSIGKALALDPNLAEAHESRAALLFTPVNGWQIKGAVEECKQALALNPNLAEGHMTLAAVYVHVGLLDEALQELHAAAAINPFLVDVALYSAITLFSDGKFQDALPFIRSYYPAYPFSKSLQAYDLWEMRQRNEAWALVREMLKTDPQEKDVWTASIHTLLLADSGRGEEAERRITEKLLRQGEGMKRFGHFHHVANLVADVYSLLGKPDLAVTWLEQTAATGFPCYPLFEHDRALDPIRQDPRFIAFMQKLKPQWEYYKHTYGQEPPQPR